VNSHLLEILVCPLCKGPLRHDRERHELICSADKLAFPVRDGIPVMLESEARSTIAAASAAQQPAPGMHAATPHEPGKPDGQNTDIS